LWLYINFWCSMNRNWKQKSWTINSLIHIHTQQEAHHSNHNSWLRIQLTAIAVKQTA
jgi:predicted DNA-binding ribbon-helix-helix protein